MSEIPEAPDLELNFVIVGEGKGSKVLQIAKQSGVTGGTIVMGRGTSRNRLLEMLALCDVKREIVLLAADSKTSAAALENLQKGLKLYKPNHGIAYSVDVSGVCGSRSCVCNSQTIRERTENTMYQSIMIIVDKGKGEAVVEAATAAGANGATIINARGSGIHETSKLFSMEIEPEKEIVLIIARQEQTEPIVASIRDNFKIDKPGHGIAFVQNVVRTYGLAE